MLGQRQRPQGRPSTRATNLVARGAQLAAATGALREGAAGGVVIVGPAGSGRTRMASEVAAEAGERRVEWVTATPAAASIPFGAFAHLLAGVPFTAAGDRLAQFAALSAALASEDAARPVVVVDDAHALDPAGAALVADLARRRAAFVVATVRPCREADPMLALWRDGHAARIDLPLLREADVVAVAEGALGGPVDVPTGRRLSDAAGGSPRVLLETIEEAVTRDALTMVCGVWTLARPLTPGPGVWDRVQTSLDGLDDAERHGVEVLAVAGRMPLEVFDGLAGGGTAQSLQRSDLVAVRRRGRRLEARLAGELLASALRERIPPGIAAGTAREVAGALERRGMRRADDVVAVATLQLAGAGGADPALLAHAAGLAARTDPALAERLARASLPARPGLRAAAALGEALVRLNRHGEAAEMLASYEEATADGPEDAARAYAVWRAAALRRRPDEALAVLAELRFRRPEPAWRAHLAAVEAQVLGRAGRHTEAAAAAAAATEDPAADAGVAGLARDAAARARAARGETAAASAPPCDAAWPRLTTLLVAARMDEAEAVAAPVHARALEDGDDATRAEAALALGWAALLRGRARTARLRLVEAAVALRRSDVDGLLPCCLSLLARVEALLGEVETACELRDEAAAQAVAGAGTTAILLADVAIAAAAGDLAGAARMAVAGAAEPAATPIGQVLLLHEAVRAGHPAEPVAAELRVLADRLGNPWAAAVARHAAAAAAADHHALAAVAADFERLGSILDAAETLDAAGRAQEPIARRPAQAMRHRAARLLERCEGARSPVMARGGGPAAQLTLREREIAVLAAVGLSNPEIARRLVVSARTVESHLYNAYAKLGVDRRDDLPRVLGVLPRPPQAAGGRPAQAFGSL